ncbi:hypothetical protein ONZ45_g10584 [Pleurotus djamor]|nr:hypothetical protein ONZ45_g10584 [Pleurotus djamor]
MDPIALTISVIEIGLKVKDSLSLRRSRAKELASDLVVNLLRIAEFCGENKLTLSKSTALGPLCHSLDVLQRDLYRIHQHCKAYEHDRGDATHRRLASAFKLWMGSDEIEEDLVRIKDRIQTSMNCILVLSCARTEVGIMRLEGTILANAHETRSCIQQLDRVFTQQLLHRDPGLQAFDHSPSEVDDIDIQYICLKSMKLIDTISVSTFASCGTNTFKGLRLPLFGALLEPKLHNALFAIADLQSRARSEILPITSIVGYALYLMNTCAGLGALDVGLKILAAVEGCIRRTLRLGTLRLRLPHHIEDEEEDDFDSLEAIVSLRIATTLADLSEQPPGDYICDDDIILQQTSHALQFSRDRLKWRTSHSTFHRVQFVDKLIPLIRYHASRGTAPKLWRLSKPATPPRPAKSPTWLMLEFYSPMLRYYGTFRERNSVLATTHRPTKRA